MSDYVIETRNLTKQYGTQMSVSDLNIHVKKGRIYGLLGRNGAGKTTTMKMLFGCSYPKSQLHQKLEPSILTTVNRYCPILAA